MGAHCILQLLDAGYGVRTTVRSLAREADVRGMLATADASAGDRLEFAAADLTSDDGWAQAVAGCDFVLHVASPFPAGAPKHEDELIIPARDGVLRVLRASRDAGVKRVVMTSSFAAIGYGFEDTSRQFTEDSWTDTDGEHVSAYVKSKTIAERAAWDFVGREGGELELAVVNPVVVLGPVLGPDLSASILLVQRLMDRAMPALPRLAFGLVDVRDVADLHLRAMTDPAAKGERFLAAAGDPMTIAEIAQVLRARMGAAGARVPTRVMPDLLVRLAARRDAALKQFVPELGKVKKATSEKAKRVLGWQPRSNEDCIVGTAESLLGLGLLKQAPAY